MILKLKGNEALRTRPRVRVIPRGLVGRSRRAPAGFSGSGLGLRPALRHPPCQAFSEYQVQQMTATFVDQFGFNDEEFADQDDSVK